MRFRGYKRFFRRTQLETSDYIKDDCLAMHCTVGVVRTRVEGPKPYTISVPPTDMGQSLKDLLESEVGCDIVFQVGDETFKAHKLILAARSPVFRAQFFGLVGNPNMDEVVVEDVEPSIFKVTLFILLACIHYHLKMWNRKSKKTSNQPPKKIKKIKHTQIRERKEKKKMGFILSFF